MTKCDAAWLAGVIDGEGCFTINRKRGGTYNCRLVIEMHYKELPTLQKLAEAVGFGRATVVRRASRADTAAWSVTSKADCLKLYKLLQDNGLRTSKVKDYELWGLALGFWIANDYDQMGVIKQYMEAYRKNHLSPHTHAYRHY